MVIAMAGFYSLFFFITLYMQNVLHYSQIEAGRRLPAHDLRRRDLSRACARNCSRGSARGRSSPSAHSSAGGAVYWLSRIPVHGSYPTDLLPGVADHVAGARRRLRRRHDGCNAGVPPTRPGLQPPSSTHPHGSAARSGLAIFSAISTSRARRPARRPRHPAGGPHRRLPPRAPRRERLPRRGSRHRRTRHQHPRGTAPQLPPRTSAHPGHRMKRPGASSAYRGVRGSDRSPGSG